MKVIIATVKVNGDWINLTDNTGKAISVSTKDKKSGNPVNQTLKTILTDPNFKQGSEVEMDVKEWEGKFFGNEVKAANKGGKSFTPKDKSFEAAQTAALACATLYANKTGEDVAKLPATFEIIHKLIMGKVTAAPVESKEAQ